MTKETYRISGMTCSACSAHIEKSVSKTQGVKQVHVNLLTNSMIVEFDETVIPSNQIIEAVKKAGANKIILETDCPYLSPQGKRGTRNDPSNIPIIAQFVADYLNISLEELAEKTVIQTKSLYGLP